MQGVEVVWLQMFCQYGVVKVVQQVKGCFVIGLLLVDGEVFLVVDCFVVELICYCLDDDGSLYFVVCVDEFGQVDDIDL